MLKITFNNPEGEAYPRLAEFRTALADRVNNFLEQEKDFTSQEPQLTFKKDGMGEPISIMFIIGLLVQYKAEIVAIAAVVKLIKNLRDLYVSFVSEREPKKDDKKANDSFELRVGDKALKLPATDQEIEDFIKQNSELLKKN